MDTMSLLERSIYFEQNKLFGLPIEIKDNKIILDDKIQLDIDEDTDLLKCLLESKVRHDKGMHFNVRQWLFNLVKAHRSDIKMDRTINNTHAFSIVTKDGETVYIKDTNQLNEFINIA